MIKYIASALLWYIRWICFKEAQADACASGAIQNDPIEKRFLENIIYKIPKKKFNTFMLYGEYV